MNDLQGGKLADLVPKYPPYPIWMSAVITAMCDITNRLQTAGIYVTMPAVTQLHYALYCEIEPRQVAVFLMRDAIVMQRQGIV